ncbi:MAG: MCE family protein [Deltaproteobacteria bacterium]|nr:MCE family protein [Deltaproteobacteria bacterium]
MESSKMNQIKVGIFVSVGMIAIMGTIFMLGANKTLFSSFSSLYADFESVQGLARGSVVSLSGVVIGNIERIDFVPENNSLRVKMKIEKEYLSRVFKGSQAEIRTQGALGDKYIYIIPGANSQNLVEDGETLPIAKATDFFNVLSERGKESEKIFDIINEMYKLTKTINAENKIGNIIANLNSSSEDFKKISKESLKMITDFSADGLPSQQFKNTLDKMNRIITKIDKGEGTLGALINDSSLHDQLKNLVGGNQRKNHIKSIIRTSIEKSED